MTLGQWLLQVLLGYLCIGWGVVCATLAAAMRFDAPRSARDWLAVFLAWILWPLFLWFLCTNQIRGE